MFLFLFLLYRWRGIRCCVPYQSQQRLKGLFYYKCANSNRRFQKHIINRFASGTGR